MYKKYNILKIIIVCLILAVGIKPATALAEGPHETDFDRFIQRDDIFIEEIIEADPNTIEKIEEGEKIVTPYSVSMIQNKRYTSYDVLDTDRFITSAAKGETKTLKKTFTLTISASVTGSFTDKYNLGLTSSLSYTRSTSHTYKGPSEDSPYNSREFRVKGFVNKGTYEKLTIGENGSTTVRKYKFKEPSKFASYSEYKNI